MSKKKIISLCLVVCLLATAIGGTLAYFTDTDEIANTMTLGNVTIDQHEYQRDANGTLVDFTQDKMLVPAVGEKATTPVDYTDNIYTMKNVQDKFVRVENTGNVDAYIRTLIAIECNLTSDEPNFGTNKVATEVKHDCLLDLVTINGATYYIHETVYLNKVAPGEFTPMSLEQIWLASDATNEEAAGLDVNGNGALDVLVLSQAVQADGFDNAQTALDTAFGDLTAAKAQKWFASIAP